MHCKNRETTYKSLVSCEEIELTCISPVHSHWMTSWMTLVCQQPPLIQKVKSISKVLSYGFLDFITTLQWNSWVQEHIWNLHLCLSIYRGSLCDHYPWCIGLHYTRDLQPPLDIRHEHETWDSYQPYLVVIQSCGLNDLMSTSVQVSGRQTMYGWLVCKHPNGLLSV